jgi:hypothetical protein
LFIEKICPPMRISSDATAVFVGGAVFEDAATICCISAKIALAEGEGEDEGVEIAGGGVDATVSGFFCMTNATAAPAIPSTKTTNAMTTAMMAPRDFRGGGGAGTASTIV